MSPKLATALVMTFIAVACSPRPLHVRGQLDRTTWVLRTREGADSYRVMMTSTQAADFLDREKELAATRSESLVVEFDAVTVPPKFPWDSYETVGPESAAYFRKLL